MGGHASDEILPLEAPYRGRPCFQSWRTPMTSRQPCASPVSGINQMCTHICSQMRKRWLLYQWLIKRSASRSNLIKKKNIDNLHAFGQTGTQSAKSLYLSNACLNQQKQCLYSNYLSALYLFMRLFFLNIYSDIVMLCMFSSILCNI